MTETTERECVCVCCEKERDSRAQSLQQRHQQGHNVRSGWSGLALPTAYKHTHIHINICVWKDKLASNGVGTQIAKGLIPNGCAAMLGDLDHHTQTHVPDFGNTAQQPILGQAVQNNANCLSAALRRGF